MTRKDVKGLDDFEFDLDDPTNCIEVYEKKEKKAQEPQSYEFYAEQEEIISNEYSENIDVDGQNNPDEASETIESMMGIESETDSHDEDDGVGQQNTTASVNLPYSSSDDESPQKGADPEVSTSYKDYEFRSQEGRFNEEFALQNTRKKKLSDLDKK